MSGIESRRCYASLGTGHALHVTGQSRTAGQGQTDMGAPAPADKLVGLRTPARIFLTWYTTCHDDATRCPIRSHPAPRLAAQPRQSVALRVVYPALSAADLLRRRPRDCPGPHPAGDALDAQGAGR